MEPPAVLLRVRRDPRRAPSVGVRAGEGWARVSVALGGAPPGPFAPAGPGPLAPAGPLALALARALRMLAALGWEGGGAPEVEGPLPPGLDLARVQEAWAAARAWAAAPAGAFPLAAPAPASAALPPPPAALVASPPAALATPPPAPIRAAAGPRPPPATARVRRLADVVAARVREGVDPPDFGSERPLAVRKAWNYIRSVGDARDASEAELEAVRIALAGMFSG